MDKNDRMGAFQSTKSTLYLDLAGIDVAVAYDHCDSFQNDNPHSPGAVIV